MKSVPKKSKVSAQYVPANKYLTPIWPNKLKMSEKRKHTDKKNENENNKNLWLNHSK